MKTNMGKKAIALAMAALMSVGLLGGCTSAKTTPVSGSATADAGDRTDTSALADDGKVLNIYCWNTQFQDRFNELCSDTIPSDVTVNWIITPSTDNAYQNKLDQILPNNESAPASDKVDLFVVEADYVLKYAESDRTLDIKGDIGLTDADLANQYDYTKKLATNEDGILKATSWEANPGIYVYRRSIAKEILGTDDPDKVQEMLSDWQKFDDVAAKMKDGGYKMLSGFDDSYRVFTNTAPEPYVDTEGLLTLGPTINQWIDQTKTYTEKGYNNQTTMWSPEWNTDQSPAGKVFGLFYAPWGVSFTLLGNALAKPIAEGGKEEPGNGIYGDFAIVNGPASYYWGGTWICGATGTDNKTLVHDIMAKMTCDKDAMKKLTEKFQDFTNNKVGMQEISDAGYTSAFLGGQNPIPIYLAAAEKIVVNNVSPYDQGIAESIGTTMADYYRGVISKEQAIDNFYTSVLEKYPNLKKPF